MSSSNNNPNLKRGSSRMREEGKKEVWITGSSHTKLKVRAAQNKHTISDEVEEILKQFFQIEESKSPVIV
jgi:hypothetical protein